MSERKEGWYWVKFVDDECAQWDGDSWFVAGMEGSVPESCFSEIGPRIPQPGEAPPIGTRYRGESGEVVAVVVPAEATADIIDELTISKIHPATAKWRSALATLPEPGQVGA